MTDDEYKDDDIKITADLILDVYAAAQEATGKQQELLLAIANVMSENLRENSNTFN
jgi:hypothetical protein